MLLAADVGGTKTDLAVFEQGSEPRTPVSKAELPSGAYPDLESLVRDFLGRGSWPVTRAVFAVAGPVVAGQAKITNLPWAVDASRLASELNLEAVHLLNDLEAIAWAVPTLGPGDLHTISPGTPMTGGAIAVIAPGTGLGESFLTWDGGRYLPHPSEGGHAGFAPSNAQQAGLLQYLRKTYDHVSVERVCSGLGIPNIYDYLRDAGLAADAETVATEIAGTPDRTRAILAAALRPESSPLSLLTIQTFGAILAAEAGDLALKVLATGGVYIAGGIPPRMIPLLDTPEFVAAFRGKGRMEDLLTHIPIHIVTSRAALTGAAIYGGAMVE